MSISNGFLESAKKTFFEYRANAMQIFLKNPRGRSEKSLGTDEAKEVKKFVQDNNIFCVAHCSYLLNFAKDVSTDLWTLNSLIADLNKIKLLGGYGVVLHIGKYLGLDKDTAYKYLEKNINYIISKTSDSYIILENTAGQGTEIGYKFDELEFIYKNVLQKSPRIKFCFDTAHAYAAGYNLNTSRSTKDVFNEFDKKIGIKNISVIHFNNTKKDLDSRVDRHENLDTGLIPKEGLKEVIRIADTNHIPLILETPEKNGITHKQDLNILKTWIKNI